VTEITGTPQWQSAWLRHNLLDLRCVRDFCSRDGSDLSGTVSHSRKQNEASWHPQGRRRHGNASSLHSIMMAQIDEQRFKTPDAAARGLLQPSLLDRLLQTGSIYPSA
jgi:hypothetical protein